MPDDEDETDDDLLRLCPGCNGSGEGGCDGTRCGRCRGAGELDEDGRPKWPRRDFR